MKHKTRRFPEVEIQVQLSKLLFNREPVWSKSSTTKNILIDYTNGTCKHEIAIESRATIQIFKSFHNSPSFHKAQMLLLLARLNFSHLKEAQSHNDTWINCPEEKCSRKIFHASTRFLHVLNLQARNSLEVVRWKIANWTSAIKMFE